MKPLDDVSTKASQKTINKNSNKNSAKENKKKYIYDVTCIFCGEIYIQEEYQPTEN